MASSKDSYDFHDQVGHLLRRAYQRHVSIFQEAIPDSDLTAAQFVTLCAVKERQGCSLNDIVKATAIDPRSLDAHGIYRFTGPARVFTDEHTAIEAIKTGVVRGGEVIALVGCGPAGTGMEETYQLTSALKHVPFGRQVALLTDALQDPAGTPAGL